MTYTESLSTFADLISCLTNHPISEVFIGIFVFPDSNSTPIDPDGSISIIAVVTGSRHAANLVGNNDNNKNGFNDGDSLSPS